MTIKEAGSVIEVLVQVGRTTSILRVSEFTPFGVTMDVGRGNCHLVQAAHALSRAACDTYVIYHMTFLYIEVSRDPEVTLK